MKLYQSENLLRKIKYNPIWETEFDWLKPSQMSDYYALCILCKQYFKIDKYGKTGVVQHAKSQKHMEFKRRRRNNLRVTSSKNVAKPAPPSTKLSKEEEVINAEILWTLKTIDCNYAFNSACGDCCSIFKLMFPDSTIAKNFDLEKTKVKYLAQFGIVPHLEKIIKCDMIGSPFSLTIDECVGAQCKKQFDCYIQYWSNSEDKFVSAVYCGTIFMPTSRADLLKTNVFELIRKLSLDCSLLLQVLVVSPNPNVKFYKLLVKELDECYFTSLLDVGPCTVNPLYTGFKKGLGQISFAYEEFLSDLIYFFKLYHNKKEDDKNLSTMADACYKFFLSRTPSRWIFLKPALQKIIEQYKNIKDHFLLYLPKQDNFKKETECTNKYKSLVRTLKDRRTLIYLHFILNATVIFEPILLSFLRQGPLIHALHESLSKLFYDLMGNFLKRSVLMRTEKKLDGEKLVQIDCRNKNFHLHNVVLNLNTRKEIGLSSLNAKIVGEIQNEFLQFYIEATSYLQNKLPINCELLKDASHLHPLRKNVDAIIRIAKSVISAIKNENVLNRLFHTQGKDKSSLCDVIVSQAKAYVCEKDLPCDNIIEHWRYVGQIKNSLGEKKYVQLYALAKCVMVLSHGNSSSEGGYVINQLVFDKNRNVIDEEDLYAIRLIKDYLNGVGGIEHFVINRELIKNVKNSYKRYVEYMDKRKKKQRR